MLVYNVITDEDEEERSCVTVLTLQPDELQSEEDDVDGGDELMSPELALLLNQSDLLHAGHSGKKTDGFNMLIENKYLVTK